MRSIIGASSLVALLLVLGCNHLVPHQREQVGDAVGKDKPAAAPTAETLVKYLNENAGRIPPGQALNCTNVDIDINADAGRIGISARMQCQAPRNFLLSGVTIGNTPVVDIGSNDKEFWFWGKQINPPYLYHCSYEGLASGLKTPLPFPFQPDMVLSALGLTPYDPAKQYTVQVTNDKRGHKFIEMTEQTLSPENKPIQKITVFNFNQVQRPDQPQVVAHILKGEQNKVICAAYVRHVQRVGGENGAIIPQMIDFDWPEQKMKMKMTIYSPQLIVMPPEKAATRFIRQNLHHQSYDLSTGALDGAGVQQAGATGIMYRR
jgi:hypothetical protein